VVEVVPDSVEQVRSYLRDDAGRFRRNPDKPARPRHKAAKLRLPTRATLDMRTLAAKAFDRLVRDIEIDLGGHDALSAIERELIEAFAGAAITMQSINTRLALGEKIDLIEHAQAASVMVRIATRLGLQRRAREVLPSPLDYAREHTEDATP
jgi:hypothetical protein